MVLAQPVLLQVLVIHHVVDQDAQPHHVPHWGQSGILASDVLGSICCDHSDGASRERVQGEVLGHVLAHISHLHVPQTARHGTYTEEERWRLKDEVMRVQLYGEGAYGARKGLQTSIVLGSLLQHSNPYLSNTAGVLFSSRSPHVIRL